MKNFRLAFVAMMFAVLSIVGANKAQAQISDPDVNLAVGNLVNVQGVDVNVLIQDITVQDVIDVTNVLNNNDVDVLVNILNGITIDNVLNNALREAEIIKGNQVVVGIAVNALTGEVENILVASKKVLGLK